MATSAPPSSTPLYEGKAKKLYATDNPQVLWQEFKDDLTAFDAVKKGQFADKGEINNTIATLLFKYLEANGVPTHFLEATGPNTMRVRRLTMLPLEVVLRNVAAGSLCKRLGRPEGERYSTPLVELYLKDDALHDPILNDEHVLGFGLAKDSTQLEAIKALGRQINGLLSAIYADAGITLVDFKLEFGVDAEGVLRLGDEISPDTCRLWETATGEKLDKDRFRFDLGDVGSGYRRVLELLKARAGN